MRIQKNNIYKFAYMQKCIYLLLTSTLSKRLFCNALSIIILHFFFATPIWVSQAQKVLFFSVCLYIIPYNEIPHSTTFHSE